MGQCSFDFNGSFDQEKKITSDFHVSEIKIRILPRLTNQEVM